MRLLSRALFTLILLGGLGFGSYAFGKYVLSSRLFGNKGSNLNRNFGESPLAPRAASSGKSRGGQDAIASVELLPEGEGNGGASTASRSNPVSDTPIDRSNRSGEDGALSGNVDDVIGGSNSDSISRRRERSSAETPTTSERPRRRRKRRKPRATPAPAAQTAIVRDAPVRQSNSPEPDVVISDDSSQRNSPAADSPAPRAERVESVERTEPRRESSSNDAPSEEVRPRRRRRVRVRAEENAPRERERVRVEPRRETPRSESPVPVPESGGGDSPVPVPE